MFQWCQIKLWADEHVWNNIAKLLRSLCFFDRVRVDQTVSQMLIRYLELIFLPFLFCCPAFLHWVSCRVKPGLRLDFNFSNVVRGNWVQNTGAHGIKYSDLLFSAEVSRGSSWDESRGKSTWELTGSKVSNGPQVLKVWTGFTNHQGTWNRKHNGPVIK